MTESILAVVVVVDCSLAVSHEWEWILNTYLYQYLKHLHEGPLGANQQCRLGFITYATNRTRPSPVVSKLFFMPLQAILGHIRMGNSFGLGSVASGGGKGTAALEGLVAAAEMFDQLAASLASGSERRPLHAQSLNQSPAKQTTPTIVARHILHIAGLPPDSAKRPLHNSSPYFDNTSWDTLPEEFKKRDIKWSMILLQQSLTRFVELHSMQGGDVIPPWFQTRSQHTVRLVGLPQRPPKRPGDPPTTPEPKRARVSGAGPQVSPVVSNASPSKVTPKTNSSPIPAPAQPNQANANAIHSNNFSASNSHTTPILRPQPPPQSQPHQPVPQQPVLPQPRQLPRNSKEELIARMTLVERDLNVLNAQLHEASKGGRSEAEVNELRKQLNMKQMIYNQMKQLHASYVGNPTGQGATLNSNIGVGVAGGANPNLNPPIGPMVQQQPPPQALPVAQNNAVPQTAPTMNVNNPNFPSSLPMGAHLLQGMQQANQVNNPNMPQPPHPPASTGPPQMPVPGPGGPEVAPDIQVQMQKLLDQRRQAEAGGAGVGGGGGAGAGLQPAPVGQVRPAQGPPFVWRGNIVTGTSGGQQLRAEIEVISPTGNFTPELWPSSLNIVPHPMGGRDEMQSFLRNASAIICGLRAMAPETNETRFKLLMEMLLRKSAYAMAHWPNPRDTRKTYNFLLISLPQDRKFGAFFQTEGGPANVPKGRPAIDFTKLPAPVLQMLQRMAPQERQKFLQELTIKQHEQKLRQQHGEQMRLQQGQGQGQPGTGPSAQMHGTQGMAGFGGGFMANNNMAALMGMNGGGTQGMPHNNMNVMQSGNMHGGFNFNPATALGQQSQVQQDMGMNPNLGGLNQAGMGANMQLNMGMGQNFGMAGDMGQQHLRQPSGGAGFPQGGVSYEMLQSFMQRNAEGGGPGGEGS